MTQLTQPMPITIYDSMSGQKRPFTPLEAGKVGMYVCGMTVYDYCHIGHARVMVGFDVVVRWLRHIGYEVNYVRNITDIDDKIINRAKDNGESIYRKFPKLTTNTISTKITHLILLCRPLLLSQYKILA
jgi:cysteinyl-tRNA synthetase